MEETFAPVLQALANNGDTLARHAHVTLSAVIHCKPRGTMRAWMQGHNGHPVTTIQVNNETGNVWAPTGRIVDATRASHVLLGESRRAYAGMTVLAVSPGALIVRDETHTVAYVIEPGANA